MEHTCCDLCHKDRTVLLFEATERITTDHMKFRVVQCSNCGLVYVDPRPSRDEIASYYPKETYDAYQPSHGVRKLKQLLKELVWKSAPGYSRRSGMLKTILGRCLGFFVLPQMEIIIPFKESGKILDVGCGNGEMIGWMKKYGWETYGIDMSRQACVQAAEHGIKAFTGELKQAHFQAEYFDVIVISHVLEHVHNPLSLLQECNHILKKEGHLIISVPNFGCFDSQLFGRSWFQIDAPRHLYHFTSDTLDKMCQGAGFQVNKWKSKLPLPLYDKSSIKIYRSYNTGCTCLYRVLLKGSFVKLIKYIISRNKGPEFSINLTAYALKRG